MKENDNAILSGEYIPATYTARSATSSTENSGSTNSSTQTGTNILTFPEITETIISSECKCAIALLRFFNINILAARFVLDYLPRGSKNSFDPNLEFGGDPFTSVSNGCNVPVLENALNNYFNTENPDFTAIGLRRLSITGLINNYIDKGIPVEIWATDNMETPINGDVISYNGKAIQLIENARAFVFVGYTDTEYYLYDPIANEILHWEKAAVTRAYNLMGNQSLAVKCGTGAYTEPDSGNSGIGGSTTTEPGNDSNDGSYNEPEDTNKPGGSTTTTTVTPEESQKNVQISIPYIAEYNVSTECKSAVTLLHEKAMKINLEQFISEYVPQALPESFDPNVFFGGDPYGDNRGCNVPVMVIALNNFFSNKQLCFNANGLQRLTMSALCTNYIDKGTPVAFWATEKFEDPVYGEEISYKNKTYSWVSNAQCYILTGYTEDRYRIFNPMYNTTTYITKETVERAYNLMGNQSLNIEEAEAPPQINIPTYHVPNHNPNCTPNECEVCNHVKNVLVADPIDASTGSHILKNHLLNLFGGQKLTVTAHYNSSKLCAGVLGIGWYHNFEKFITVFGNDIFAYENPSEFSKYTKNENNTDYLNCTNGKEGYRISNTENGYCMDCNGDRYEHYNLNGQLVKVVDHQGFEITLTHGDSCTTITDTITGKSIYLEKDSSGKVTRVYDSTGRETILTYENNYLVNIKDVSNCMLTYTYDENGRVATGTDRDDVCYFSNVYDELGRVVCQKDGHNSTEVISTLTYGEDGAHVSTNRLGKQSTRTFNDLGLLTCYVDENENATTYTYDDAFNVSSVTDGLGHCTEIIYNNFKKPVQIKDKNENITEFLYDTSGNLLKITYPDDSTESFVYNTRNQVVQHTDLRNTVTLYTYDENGLLSSKKVGSKNAVTYVYENGLLVSETDAKGNTTRYAYDAAEQMTTKTDATGKTTLYEHDKAGNLLKVTDPDGHSVSYTYNSNYQKTSMTDANGNKTWYSYTENMKPCAVQLPDGSTSTYVYDAEDRLIEEIDGARNVTKTTYDDGGRVISKEYADEGTETFEYDAANRVVKHTNPKGAVTETTYDANGNVRTVTDAAGNVTENFYDEMARVVRTINPAGGAVVYEYSPAGDLLSETDAFGNKKTYTYDGFGNRLSATDARGNTTYYTYDANDNLLTVTDALENVTTYTYDALNRVSTVKNAKGATVTYGYDAEGRQTTITDAKGNTFTKIYDANGNVWKVLDAKGNVVTETTYNELNLPAVITDAFGKKTKYTYNALGKVSSDKDTLGNERQYLYNARGQSVVVSDPSGKESTASYDLLGNTTCLAGPLGGATHYTYDNLGRLISESTVSGGTVQYTYNALNLKSQLTNARGQLRQFTYDVMGRITSHTSPEGTVSYVYDANGNVLTVTDSLGIITRTYDALNRVASCTDTYGKVIRYEYDAVGNLTKLIYPDNTSVLYAYDGNNNLVSVTDWAGRVTTYTYDENNRVIGVAKPDGSTTTTAYDNKQRIVSTVEKLSDDTIISGFEYEYDEIGRISSEKLLDKNQKFCYTYDVQSRVTKRIVLNLNDNTSTEETFTYDAAGNITADDASVFVYDTNNRLTQYNGNPVSYDLDGNMLSDGSRSYSYDSGNRLISAGGHTYTYNAENVRIRNLCTDSDTTYAYNTNSKLSQLLTMTKNGVVTKFVYGLGLIGEETNNTFKTYHFDYRGSTVAITDANGNITDTFAYDTYGKQTERTGTSNVIFAYNGRDGVVTDANGLIYMRARYYSPELRRFVNADIVAGDISNAVTLNRFAYANGNPVSFVDPFGLSAERDLSTMSNDEIADAMSYSLSEILYGMKKYISFTQGAEVSYTEPSTDIEYYYTYATTLGDGPWDFSIIETQLDTLYALSLSGDNISVSYDSENSLNIGITHSKDLGENVEISSTITRGNEGLDISCSIKTKLPSKDSVTTTFGIRISYEMLRNTALAAFGVPVIGKAAAHVISKAIPVVPGPQGSSRPVYNLRQLPSWNFSSMFSNSFGSDSLYNEVNILQFSN